jgi:hypothetical protein
MLPREHARIVAESWKTSVNPAPTAGAPVRPLTYRLEALSRHPVTSSNTRSPTAVIGRGLGDGIPCARNLKKWKPNAVRRHIGAIYT